MGYGKELVFEAPNFNLKILRLTSFSISVEYQTGRN